MGSSGAVISSDSDSWDENDESRPWRLLEGEYGAIDKAANSFIETDCKSNEKLCSDRGGVWGGSREAPPADRITTLPAERSDTSCVWGSS